MSKREPTKMKKKKMGKVIVYPSSVKKGGNSAVIPFYKRFIGKKVYVVIK